MAHFKILSIDGGGIKGLYSAKVLATFEKYYNTNVSEHFDLICGTSTGGIIALGASLKMPMENIVDFYKKYGPSIFSSRLKKLKRLGIKLLVGRQAVISAKYSQVALRKALISEFKDKKIKDSNNLLCIPAYNLTSAEPRIFKRDYGKFNQDNDKTYVDIALATSSAPTYLPIMNISKIDYADGGLYANNPVLVGLTEYLYNFANDKRFDGVDILSISSCEKSLGWSPKKKKQSFLGWSETLFDSYSNGQSKVEQFFLNKLIESNTLKFGLNIIRVANKPLSASQATIVSMDNASADVLDLLEGIGAKVGADWQINKNIQDLFSTPKTINPNDYGKQ